MVETLSKNVPTHTFLKREERRGYSGHQWFPTSAREQTIAAMLLAVQRAQGTVFIESERGAGTTACLGEWRRRYTQSDGPVWFLDGRDPDTALKLDHALMKCMVAQPATSTWHPVIVLDHASSIRWELLSTWMRRVKGGMAEERRDVRWVVVGDGELKQHLSQLFPDEVIVTLSFQPFTANESQRFLLQRGYDVTLSKAQAVHEQSRGNPQRMFEVLKDMNCIARIADHSRRDAPIPSMSRKRPSVLFLRTALIFGIGATASALYFSMSSNNIESVDQTLQPADSLVVVSPNQLADSGSLDSGDLAPVIDGSLVAPMAPESPDVQGAPSNPINVEVVGSSAESSRIADALVDEMEVTGPTFLDGDSGVQDVSESEIPGPIDLSPPIATDHPDQLLLDWLAALDPSHFFVQLTTGRVAEDVDKFVAGLKSELPSIRSIPFEKTGKQRFAVVMGPFNRFADAQKALASLPEPVRANQPWIRTVGQLQASVKL